MTEKSREIVLKVHVYFHNSNKQIQL